MCWTTSLVVAAALLMAAAVPAEGQPADPPGRSLVAGGMLGFADGLSLQGRLLGRALTLSIPVEARVRLGST